MPRKPEFPPITYTRANARVTDQDTTTHPTRDPRTPSALRKPATRNNTPFWEVPRATQPAPRGRVIFDMILDLKLESKNGTDALHPMQESKIRKFAQNRVIEAMMVYGIKTPTGTKPKRQILTIWRIAGSREKEWDEANITGGTIKRLEDAIVQIGFAKNDTRNVMHLQPVIQDFTRRPYGPRCQIRLEVIEE